MQPFPLPRGNKTWHFAEDLFLRATGRKKEGKDNGCYSVMENQRVAGGKTVQRTVLYLDEINVLDRIEQLSGKAMRAWPGAFG